MAGFIQLVKDTITEETVPADPTKVIEEPRVIRRREGKVLFIGAWVKPLWQEDNSTPLTRWCAKKMGPLLDVVYAAHMTLQHGPTASEVDQYKKDLGRILDLKIVGYYGDAHVQVVLAEDTSDERFCGHITISTDGKSVSEVNESKDESSFYNIEDIVRAIGDPGDDRGWEVDGPVILGQVGWLIHNKRGTRTVFSHRDF